MNEEVKYIESLFLRANQKIDEQNYEEAKSILEEILELDPTFGRAYNHLGWLYSEILKMYDKAEPLYRLALKYEPEYGAPYVNYLYLLFDTNQLDKVDAIAQKAQRVQSVDKAILNHLLGRREELKGNLKAAYNYFDKAASLSLNERFISDMNAQKQRVLSRLNRLGRIQAALFW